MSNKGLVSRIYIKNFPNSTVKGKQFPKNTNNMRDPVVMELFCSVCCREHTPLIIKLDSPDRHMHAHVHNDPQLTHHYK